MTSCDGLVTAFNDNPISPGLKVSTPTIQVEVGKTFRCNATASTKAKLIFTSADPSIATVDSYGMITGVAEGKTTITVTTEGKDSQAKSIFTIESLTIPVEVVILEVPVESVKLDQTELTGAVGDDPVKLVATVNPDNASDKTVKWTTSDETVVKVDDKGEVTFVGGGTATITATATNGTTDAADDKTASCELTVKCLVDKITLNKTTLDLMKGGDGETLTATINPTGATETELKWESSKPAVATVDANGKVTPVAQGYATITCTATNSTEETDDDIVANCEVRVATLLANLTADYEAEDGDVLTGTLDGSTNNIALTIADGATVTLDGMTINGVSINDEAYTHAGLTIDGDATIILKGENKVTGFYETYPGIYVKPGKTLTIKGDGKLTASGSDLTKLAAGIGGGYQIDCGNIVIESGTIVAKGGNNAAGIGGGGDKSSCGNITIKGGDITASCEGNGGAAIGCAANLRTCGDITITGGTIKAEVKGNNKGIGIGYSGFYVTGGKITITGGDITATGGSSDGTGIGVFGRSICGDIDISGGTIVATGSLTGAGIGSGHGNSTYPSTCGNIKISGGDITATGGSKAAGIGTGDGSGGAGSSVCGNITITAGVTQVTATKGAGATNSIGLADANGICGTVTIDPAANVTQN